MRRPFGVMCVSASRVRRANAVPPKANTHAVTTGISQSQSTPAWIAHAANAPSSAA